MLPPQKPSLLLLLLFLHLLLINLTSSIHFDFSSLTLTSLKLLGDAHLKNGSILLSRDLPVPTSGSGRALFSSPIPLLPPSPTFSTSFSFSIENLNPSSTGGGLAFLLSPDDLSLGDPGPFLGLLPSPSPLLAVEFDTLMDPQFSDPNDNHVGLDLNSLTSSQSADLHSSNILLKSGLPVHAWIDYTSSSLLQVFASHSPSKPPLPLLSLPLNLPLFLPHPLFVGFSASTQGSTELHSIHSWSFSSPSQSINITTTLPNSPPSSSSSSSSHHHLPAFAFATATAAFLIATSLSIYALLSLRRRLLRPTPPPSPSAASILKTKTPREFTYRSLLSATQSFSQSRVIGHGAFGTVYKAILPETGSFAAVKRSTNPLPSSSSLLSELSIISSLRHRNLLPLQGFCQRHSEILLVYDYMPHGSLDHSLFHPSSPPLPWPTRLQILLGVASALSYLHHECDPQVIHRDVKSSNVLLDHSFRPRLADFGLARQIDHNHHHPHTTTAGTIGYLAPEYILTGRADDKTDVFSFGALVLEVACGRRPIDERWRGRGLVEWVWGLHGQGRLVEAVDARMELGGIEEGEIRRVLLVGLGCSSPDPAARPGMRSVVQMLGDEADPPHVPLAKPAPAGSFGDNHQLLLSLQQDSVDGLLRFSSSDSSSSEYSLASVVGGGG